MKNQVQSESVKNNTIFGKEASMALKGLLVILMFWAHIFTHPDRLLDGISWISMGSIAGKSIEDWLVPFFHISVPLFFFISGYGFLVVAKKNDGYSFRNLSHQLLKLYSKYWLVFIIAVPIAMAMGILEFNPLEFFLNFVGLDSTYCGEWWFLGTYVLILIFFFIFYNLFRLLNKKYFHFNSKFAGVILIIVSLFIAIAGYGGQWLLTRLKFDTDNLAWYQFYYLLIKQPMFVMGFVCAKFHLIDEAYQWINKIKTIYKILIGIVLFVCLIIIPYISIVPETFIYFIYTPLFCFCFCSSYHHIHKSFKKALMFVGKYSTYMWLTHSLLLYKFIQRIVFWPRFSILCWAWLIILSLITAIILTILENSICYCFKRLWNYYKERLNSGSKVVLNTEKSVNSEIVEDNHENHSSSTDEVK